MCMAEETDTGQTLDDPPVPSSIRTTRWIWRTSGDLGHQKLGDLGVSGGLISVESQQGETETLASVQREFHH